MNHKVERISPHRPEATPSSGIPTFPSDNLIAQKHNEGTPTRSSKPSRRILTPVEAGELLHCDPKTITRWARQGYIPAHPIGQGKKKYWRFFEDELIAWLLDQKNGALAA